ncbi:MAG: hypothetical protein GY936_05075 [Ignavibacteriae bacterium]|nr:hypothetical protein [Ignavibacteriota bacterium]
MKTSQLFWGFFFISIGAFFLLEKYFLFYIDWNFIWDLWPVIIIFAGLSIIARNTFIKPIMSILFGILIAVLVFGFFSDVFDGVSNRHSRSILSNSNSNKKVYSVDYDSSVTHANLSFNAGAGSFKIENTTDKLVKGLARGIMGNYNFEQTLRDSTSWVTVDMEKVDGKFLIKDVMNKLSLSLNERPTWSMELGLGAAKTFLDLRPFKVKNLVINTGASNTKIKLGDKTKTTYVNVEMGVASLTIYVPKTSGCKVSGEMILMKKEFSGFDKKGSDYYITDNYEESPKKILIDIDGGVSAFKVRRY